MSFIFIFSCLAEAVGVEPTSTKFVAWCQLQSGRPHQLVENLGIEPSSGACKTPSVPTTSPVIGGLLLGRPYPLKFGAPGRNCTYFSGLQSRTSSAKGFRGLERNTRIELVSTAWKAGPSQIGLFRIAIKKPREISLTGVLLSRKFHTHTTAPRPPYQSRARFSLMYYT